MHQLFPSWSESPEVATKPGSGIQIPARGPLPPSPASSNIRALLLVPRVGGEPLHAPLQQADGGELVLLGGANLVSNGGQWGALSEITKK